MTRTIEHRDFLSTVEGADLVYNNTTLQWNKNINIAPATYSATQTLNGSAYTGMIYVRLFAIEGALVDIFPSYEEYSVGDVILTCAPMYAAKTGSTYNLTGEIALVYLVKHTNTSSYICSSLLSVQSGQSTSIVVSSHLSIKTICIGSIFNPIIRFLQ